MFIRAFYLFDVHEEQYFEKRDNLACRVHKLLANAFRTLKDFVKFDDRSFIKRYIIFRNP